MCVWVGGGGGQTLFQRDLRIAQFFSFKAGGASSPSSLAPTKTLDECWWYLTWSVRRTCHVTISISEFCDSLTAATVLHLSLFKTCLGTTAFSRAKSTNQYEPREQTFCLTSVCVCSDSVTLLVFGTPPLVVAIRKVHSNVLQWCPCSGVFYGKDINLWLFNSLLWKTIVFDR